MNTFVVTTACDELMIGLLVMFFCAGTVKIGLTVDCRGTIVMVKLVEKTLFSVGGCVVSKKCRDVESSGLWLWRWDKGHN